MPKMKPDLLAVEDPGPRNVQKGGNNDELCVPESSWRGGANDSAINNIPGQQQTQASTSSQ